MATGSDWPEIGRDVLDPPRTAPPGRWRLLPRRRLALGVRATAAPTAVFILCGVALGPSGLNLLTPAVLNRLDLLVSVALAILGVFVGLGMMSIPRSSAYDALIGGAAAATTTIGAVAAGLFLLLGSWQLRVPLEALAFASMAGICCSASAALHSSANVGMGRAAYLADADDVPLVLLGAVAIAALSGGSAAQIALRLGLTVVAGVSIGVAGWLLFDRATGAAERGVYVTGAILLIAGAGAYLGTSPLLCGCIAAVVWVRAPGGADRITAADLAGLQHPLVAILLIFAGATIAWTPPVLALAAAVLLLRLAGKLLASLIVARILQIPPAILATALLPPGVVGIALALNAEQVLGRDVAMLVAVVTLAAVAAELVAAFLPREAEEETPA
jgi:hypothetical protein